MQGEKIRNTKVPVEYYSVDLQTIRAQLASAQEMGANAKPVEISLPTLGGTIERFSVYSFPVVVKELADKYQLGSYIGVGIDDPRKTIRFSTAPNDFQSMIVKDGVYQFIEPQNKEKTVYGVHAKTHNTDGQGFLCSMNESVLSKKQIADLYKSGKKFINTTNEFSKNSDQKYRTLRLVVSVTAEYTTYFGGTSGALAAINATLTRCNGVFEKDFALHLNLQNYPALIYTDASTDPYSAASSGAGGAWNTELQSTLTSVVGNANYDIGHLFGASGGGGNAGCIGCICVNPTSSVPEGKGSGFTSPGDGNPQGDYFDIDYVAHEIGHQLGANHTFSFNLEGTGVNMEPGSGSTIMGYAGITSADVQAHSDPYFHAASIVQVQNNLNSKTCDVETAVSNSPPVISALPTYSIPKGTAFVLTATVTDPEGDPMTYCWEQFDDAGNEITTTNGTNSSGADFRSLPPTNTPTRYFPKFSTVMNGNLTDTAGWETVSLVQRQTNFAITVRDNNASSTSQQTKSAQQTINVGAAGPFKLTSTTVYNNAAGALTWDVVNTNNAPYSVANVKIDYTTDNGATWTVLTASTPNDGAESFSFPTFSTGATFKIRISAINNVFYAVGPVTVAALAGCSTSAPTGISVSGISQNQAQVSWAASSGATYSVQYRIVGTTTWTIVSSSINSILLSGLTEGTQYEVQVANICSGTTGAFSTSTNFTTLLYQVCAVNSGDASEDYISNVTVTPSTGTAMVSTSAATTYSDYTNDSARLITLQQGTTGNSISVTKDWPATQYDEGVTAWIDFDRNGSFEVSEIILTTSPDKTTPVTGTFAVPANAYAGTDTVIMRVIMQYNNQPSDACNNIAYGEIEDYAVKITPTLGVKDAIAESIQIYPNPTTDILNITKVADKTPYKIHNAVGQLVSKGTILDHKISVQKLVKGVYVISIETENQTIQQKFIKK